MAALGTVGTLVRVTPWDDLQYWPSPYSEWVFVDDRTPFVFRVEGWLQDGHISYGLYGRVVDGPERYRNLLCSIIVREDGSDWRIETRSSAGFKVGPSIVVRDHRYDFRHPEGTTLDGYPQMSRFAEVKVLEAKATSRTIRVSLLQPPQLAPAFQLMNDLDKTLQREGKGSFIKSVGNHVYLLELTDPSGGLDLVQEVIRASGVVGWEIWRVTDEGDDIELLAAQ